jgi:hypothetical protein
LEGRGRAKVKYRLPFLYLGTEEGNERGGEEEERGESG